MDEAPEGKIWDIKGSCYRCGSEITISEYLYRAPLVGSVIISKAICGSCGYRYRSVRMAESVGPQRLKLYVDEPEDLNVIVVRASTASIYIPEFGVSIEPGPASEGFITTIEGILDRVLRIMNMLKEDEDVDRDRWEEIYYSIQEAREGRKPFTLILRDPDGVSRIISDKTEKERLYTE